jgi:hypothetical protein
VDITRSTLFGVIALVGLGLAVFAFRGKMLRERDACGARLRALAPALGAYAAHHHGDLPRTPAELRAACGGTVPVSTDVRRPYQLAPEPRVWGPPALPYLWDVQPHRFVNGVHVLYTDGSVRLQVAVPGR